MGLLLDTHVFLWWLEDGSALPTAVRKQLADPHERIAVSAASIWEMAIKIKLGKLKLSKVSVAELSHLPQRCGFTELPISARHAAEAGALPPHHQDPFDRMLIAQARVENLNLISADSSFRKYDVALLPIH